jgi:hypothetical protein
MTRVDGQVMRVWGMKKVWVSLIGDELSLWSEGSREGIGVIHDEGTKLNMHRALATLGSVS